MKHFRAADKFHAGGDEKHDINFHWPKQQFNKHAVTDSKLLKWQKHEVWQQIASMR
jgi:hypothetical protein